MILDTYFEACSRGATHDKALDLAIVAGRLQHHAKPTCEPGHFEAAPYLTDQRALESLFERRGWGRGPEGDYADLPGEGEFTTGKLSKCIWIRPKIGTSDGFLIFFDREGNLEGVSTAS